MIPREPPCWGDGAYAEKLVFEALREAFSQDTFIFHRFSFVEEHRVKEKEIDFLIMHREKGMLALECKGQGVRRRGDGSWERVFHDGYRDTLKKSPFTQAKQAIYGLVQKLEPKVREVFPRLRGFPLVFGYAVIFPRAKLKQLALPQNIDPQLVYDAGDLDRIGEKVEETFSFWAKASAQPTPLTQPEFRKFRRRILHPNLEIVPCLGADIQAGNRAFVKLTREQSHVVHGVLDNPRVKVCGGAGTGKTVLAIEAARILAEKGCRVLFLCFNRALGNYLKRAIKELYGDTPTESDSPKQEPTSVPPTPSGHIDATTFHRLCARAQHLSGSTRFTVPEEKQAANRFWQDEAPMVLLEALESGELEKYDAVVVDEGQDFAASWWDVLEDCLYKEPPTADRSRLHNRMVVFYDPSQVIFGRPAEVPGFPLFRLTRNFRNTRQIAQVVQTLGDVEMVPAERCPDGPPPEVHREPSAPKLKKQMGDLLRHLVNKENLETHQIVILTPHSRKNSFLKGEDSVGDFPLVDTVSERRQNPGSILHTTIAAFKGLESDVVLFVHADPDDPRCSRNARYVAVSRARHVLHVYGKKNPLQP